MKQKLEDYDSDVEDLSSSSWDTCHDNEEKNVASRLKSDSNLSASSSWSTISQTSNPRIKNLNWSKKNHCIREEKINRHYPKKKISHALLSQVQSQSSISSSESYMDESTLDFQEVPISLDLSSKAIMEILSPTNSSKNIISHGTTQSHEAFVQYLRQQCEIVVQKYFSGQNQCQTSKCGKSDMPNSVHLDEDNSAVEVRKRESKYFKAQFQSEKDGLNSRIRWYSDTFILKRKNRNHHERVTKQTSEETLQDSVTPTRVYSDFTIEPTNPSRKNVIKREPNIENIVQEIASQIKIDKNNAKNISHSGDSNAIKPPSVPINSNLKSEDELLNDETYENRVQRLTEKHQNMMNKIMEKWQSVAPVVKKTCEIDEFEVKETKSTEESQDSLEDLKQNKNEINIPKLNLEFSSESSYSSWEVSSRNQIQELKIENEVIEETKIVKEEEAAVEKPDERANDVITFETSDKGNEDSTLLTEPNSITALEQLSFPPQNTDVSSNIIEQLRASNNLLKEAIAEQQAIREAEGKAYSNILEQVTKNLIQSPDKSQNNVASVQSIEKPVEKNVCFVEANKSELILNKNKPDVTSFKDSSSSDVSQPTTQKENEMKSSQNSHKNESDFLPQWLISEALYNNVSNSSNAKNESNETKLSMTTTSIDSSKSNYQLMSFKIQAILEDAARKIEKLENDREVSETQHQKEIEWHKNNFKEMEAYFKQQIFAVLNLPKSTKNEPEPLQNDTLTNKPAQKLLKNNPILKLQRIHADRGLKNEISQLKKRMTILQRHYQEMKKENEFFKETNQRMRNYKNDEEIEPNDWYEKSVKRICEKEENEAVKINSNKLQILQDQVRNSTQQIINQNKTIKDLKTKVNEYESTIANLKCRLSRSESVCHHKQLLLENMKSKLNEKTEKSDKPKKIMRPFEIKKQDETIQLYREREDYLNEELSKLRSQCQKLNQELIQKKNYIDNQMDIILPQIMEEKKTEFINVLEKYKSQIETEQKKSEAIVNRLKQYESGLEEFLWLVDEETCQKLWKNDSMKKAHQMACTVLRLSPQELSSLFKEVYSKEFGSGSSFEKWLQEYRTLISKENFSSYLAKFLLNVCVNAIKKKQHEK